MVKEKIKVLFVCVHNAGRSQIAEELLRKMAGDRFEVESAGLEPGKLNPVVVEALKEEGIDITGKQTKAVFDLFKKGNHYSYVITVCEESSAERCPIFPGLTQRLHWSFADPSKFEGTHEEKLAKTRKVREEIRSQIKDWLQKNSK
jgi:arsenate reductase